MMLFKPGLGGFSRPEPGVFCLFFEYNTRPKPNEKLEVVQHDRELECPTYTGTVTRAQIVKYQRWT
jgi:hypothetical protein